MLHFLPSFIKFFIGVTLMALNTIIVGGLITLGGVIKAILPTANLQKNGNQTDFRIKTLVYLQWLNL